MTDENENANDNLITLWEQMGSSTGSLLGRIIGMTAQYGLQVYEQTVVSPLRQASSYYTTQSSQTEVPSDIRARTWQEMGKAYGDSLGTSIGTAMDILIGSVKSTVSEMPSVKQADNSGDPASLQNQES